MRHLLVLFFKGVILGLAWLMPGFTAATAAFVLGSYGQILQAVKSLNFKAASYLFHGRLRELGEYVPWKLLLMMPLGAACAVFILPQFLPLTDWMELYKPHLYAGFCGAVFGGLSFTLFFHRGGGFLGILLFFGGIAGIVTLMLLPITPLIGHWPWLFLHGIAAVFTEAVPGLANGFTDRPLADYGAVAYYADHGYWPALVLFALGLLTGVVLLVSLFTFSLRKFSEQTLSLLMGMTAGILLQLWPLRHLQSDSEAELMLVGASFIGGIAFSGMLQFLQRRTLA